MSNMILTDRTNTFTFAYEDVKAIPIWNSNTSITIGGVVKSQSDSQRLQITSNLRLTKDELDDMMEILKNFSASLYYTPSRILYDKTAIEEMTVICGAPEVSFVLGQDCNRVYYVTLVMEEVIEE